MSIQFPCPGCSQPIEVDGEFAGRQAQCPFCNRVVTVPAQSTLPERIELARPVGAQGGPPPWPGGLPPVPHPDARALAARSGGGYSLMCAILAVLLTVVGVGLAFYYTWPKIEPLFKTGTPDQAAMQSAIAEAAREHPWIAAPNFSASFFAVVGLSLGIIAFSQGDRSARTWVGLITCGLMVGCCLLSFVSSGISH